MEKVRRGRRTPGGDGDPALARRSDAMRWGLVGRERSGADRSDWCCGRGGDGPGGGGDRRAGGRVRKVQRSRRGDSGRGDPSGGTMEAATGRWCQVPTGTSRVAFAPTRSGDGGKGRALVRWGEGGRRGSKGTARPTASAAPVGMNADADAAQRAGAASPRRDRAPSRAGAGRGSPRGNDTMTGDSGIVSQHTEGGSGACGGD